MNKYIICTNSGVRTIRQMKTKMKDVSFVIVSKTNGGRKRRITIFKNNKLVKTLRGDKPILEINNSIIIRYGSRYPVKGSGNIFYNESKNINAASKKMESRVMFKNSGVSCPRLFSSNSTPRSFPIVARPFNHSKGRDFNLLNTPIELKNFKARHPGGYYYSQFIHKEREFRVHCAHGKVLMVKEKPKPKNKNQPIWNIDANGEAFVTIPWGDYDQPVIKSAIAQALKATAALDLDFAAIDVMTKNDTAYVLEANTAPSLYTAEYSEQRYIDYFQYLFRFSNSEKLKHWDTTRFSKSKSLSWKNKQFNSTTNIINE